MTANAVVRFKLSFVSQVPLCGEWEVELNGTTGDVRRRAAVLELLEQKHAKKVHMHSFAERNGYVFPKTLALMTDCVVFELDGRVLLVRRKHEPFAGFYALPGGFVGR